MKKAQVAYEFMMVFFVLAVGFTTWITVSYSFQEDFQKIKNIEKIEDFALSLKHEIYVVAQMHEGFSKTIELPQTINNQQYEIKAEHILNANNYNFSTIYINSETIGFYTHFDVPLLNKTQGKQELKPGQKIILTKKQGIIELT